MTPADSRARSLVDEAFIHHREGRLGAAEELYRTALKTDSDNFQALQLLGTLALRSGRIGEAISLLENALVLLKRDGSEAPRHAPLYNNLGIALRILGRADEATALFNRGLKLDPKLAELHISLGRAWMERGDFTAAAVCYETALSLNPDLTSCHCDLGTAYAQSGRLEDAAILYRRTLATDPYHWAARINLAQILRRTEKYDEAIMLLTQLSKESPADPAIHSQLGIVYAAMNRLDLSLNHFHRVLAQKPNDAEALQYVANIQQATGDDEEADKNYRRSLQLRPLITIPAIKSPPDFRALLLFAPGSGNTPLDCLADQAEYESNILNLLPDAAYDIDMLRARTDVIVNLIADVDQGFAMLTPAKKLIDNIQKPTVNHPDKILQTDRESIAHLLTATPDCRVPHTRCYSSSALRSPAFDLTHTPFRFPFLVRPAGTHGGVDFEKIYEKTELDAFLTRCPAAYYYFTKYVDYRSADGLFRKYRFIFVGEEILPYHLAIDDKWKIHHVTTDMANQPWMQEEEKSFLENPHSVFGVRQYDALHAIRKTVGLDYFGIDCALDREGRVVVFEVNACMLVHQHNEKFPYKTEPVRRIKMAFDAMLKRMAKV